MDGIRYCAALLLLMTMPGGVLYWVSIHPFIRFWRRLGPRVTLAIHFFFMSLLGLVFFLFRAPLLAVEFGSNALLMAFGVILLATSVALRVRLSRQLTKKVLMGVAELAPNPDRFPLLTEGIYSRVRNPRYLQVMLAVLGWALIANYLESYIVFAATVVLLRIVIWMEEKELRDRYGNAFVEYCARVPRLIPKF